MVTIGGDSSGKLYGKSQVDDYRCRGHALQESNLVQFIADTYEDQPDPATQSPPVEAHSAESGASGSGRPRNERIRYQNGHPRHDKIVRVVRSMGHNNLANFIGGHTIPRSDDPEIYDYYCASILVLLKPWRDLARDLKQPNETWADAFAAFKTNTDTHTRRMIDGFQYYHECESAAKERRAERQKRTGQNQSTDDFAMDEDSPVIAEEQQLTPKLLDELRSEERSPREQQHARLAVLQAFQAGVFKDAHDTYSGDTCLPRERQPSSTQGITHSSPSTQDQLSRWREQMQDDISRQALESLYTQDPEDGGGDVQLHDEDDRPSVHMREVEMSEEALTPASVAELKVDQRRAYDIVSWHLDQSLAGKDPPPLRMIISGEGGTGKSKVIQTITNRFQESNASRLLVKGAYTGIAASLINGKTTHIIGSISQNKGRLSDEAKAKLQRFFLHVRYLIIDEYSMIGKTVFAALSRNIGIGKQQAGDPTSERSFGGISVILCGDHHQFPPVMGGEEALYWPSNTYDSTESQLGRAIFDEFREVVILREQMRVTDTVWRDFLRNLRFGRVQPEDITMLRGQLLGSEHCAPTDFTTAPWKGAGLVTPRHAVRLKWNDHAVQQHCADSGCRRFVIRADDTVKDRRGRRDLTLREKVDVQRKRLNATRADGRNQLPDCIDVAIGMKVMVTTNVETDLDITNGARGTVVGIVLHEAEPPIGDGDVIHLQHQPAYILVKLDRTRATRLAGLEDQVIPIEPIAQSFDIRTKVNGKLTTKRVHRRQLPMASAYAFTDYRAQGQTIPYVLVDLAQPPSNGLSLFNLYVALSRSSGRETI